MVLFITVKHGRIWGWDGVAEALDHHPWKIISGYMYTGMSLREGGF